ncbi:MAG: acyltransferase, partial [Mesorhizobium sp.]
MHPDHGRHLLGNPGNARGIFLRRAAHDNRPLPDRELPSLRRRFSNLEGAQGADPQDAWIAGVAPMAAVAFGRNNPWLDLVRSAAILLVMLRHGERALHLAAGDADLGALQTIFLNGWVGVDLFFVLSGYLIARHLLRAGVGSPDFRIGRYLAMRALRIVPAYFAVLALVVAGAFPLFGVAPERLALRVVYHLVFLQDYLPSDIDVVGRRGEVLSPGSAADLSPAALQGRLAPGGSLAHVFCVPRRVSDGDLSQSSRDAGLSPVLADLPEPVSHDPGGPGEWRRHRAGAATRS